MTVTEAAARMAQQTASSPATTQSPPAKPNQYTVVPAAPAVPLTRN
jgi:hypothetical protein